ncbi:MAG TPA: hypothetical protein VHV30_16265, partial [Polyangiaceae bacterium]|nr:hypothetical protein [Polyangiaceae bacterium]
GLDGVRAPAFAVSLLEPACARGDARACFHLALLHLSGTGTTQDTALSEKLFAVACEGEEVAACAALADREEGKGALASAADLRAKACSLGDARSCDSFAPRASAVPESAGAQLPLPTPAPAAAPVSANL